MGSLEDVHGFRLIPAPPVIPERVVHAKGWGAYGTFTVRRDITRYTKVKIFSEVGKKTGMIARF